jgi:flagellar protein FliO/FliZ
LTGFDARMDVIDFARYFGALAFVLALVGFAALAARRYGAAGLSGLVNKNAKARRLSIVESLMVGPRHKLYLFKRDGVEHLVLIGPQGTSVVESGVAAPALAEILALHRTEDAA